MKLVKFTLLFLILSLAGCAATELTTLDAIQNRQARLLALACYHNSEGFRLRERGGLESLPGQGGTGGAPI